MKKISGWEAGSQLLRYQGQECIKYLTPYSFRSLNAENCCVIEENYCVIEENYCVNAENCCESADNFCDEVDNIYWQTDSFLAREDNCREKHEKGLVVIENGCVSAANF